MESKKYPQLVAELAALEVQIQEVREREKHDAIEQIHRLMDTYSIQHKELMRGWGSRGRYKKKPMRPKYRNPETGETWAGRGNPPLWLRGKNRSEFLIDKPTTNE